MEEGRRAMKDIGLPVVLRPAYTLGGTGGGFADTEEEFEEMMEHALAVSPVHQVLVEKSVKGYQEIEFEVMRDATVTHSNSPRIKLLPNSRIRLHKKIIYPFFGLLRLLK